jgi:DNA topoisomerase-1
LKTGLCKKEKRYSLKPVIIGEEFSAKDFRTWGGTVFAVKELLLPGAPESEKDGNRKIALAVKKVSRALNNTPSICRNYYIHPVVIDRFRDKTLFSIVNEVIENNTNGLSGISKFEKSVLQFLTKNNGVKI